MAHAMDVWGLARDITSALVSDLTALEHHIGGSCGSSVPRGALEEAVRSGWSYTIAVARRSVVTLDPQLIASLHERLARSIGAPGIGVFRDGDPPQDWTNFKQSLTDAAVGNRNSSMADCDAWIFAQFYWGQHVQSLAPSVAWLLINGIRLQEGRHPLVPDPRHSATLQQCLQWAGPDLYDAESLRALFGRYATEQDPRS
jgi:hypothetical protein